VLVGAQPSPASVDLVVPVDEAPPLRVLTQVLDLRSVTGDAVVPSRLVPPAGLPLAEGTSMEVVIDVDVREAAGRPLPTM
jgi:hypothetical protein